jgi:hypothetical protein
VRELRGVCRRLCTIVHRLRTIVRGRNTQASAARNAPERAAVTFFPVARIPD